MTEPTDHQAAAERMLTDAEAAKTAAPNNVLDAITSGLDVIGSALIGIGHALLAQQQEPPPLNVIKVSGNPTEAEIAQLRAKLRSQHPGTQDPDQPDHR